MKSHQKLELIIEQAWPTVVDNLIVKDKNCYRVFGKYLIVKTKHGWCVQTGTMPDINFGTVKSAMAWCIADKNNQLKLAREIVILDEHATRLKQDINVRLTQSKQYSSDLAETVELKLLNRQAQSRAVENELSKCINLAKYWQLRGFINETARTCI